MGSPQDLSSKSVAKAIKKQSKNQQKLAKAKTKAESQTQLGRPERRPIPPDSMPADDSSLSPAERSARAAEAQLGIRRRQMWIALAGVIIALGALFYSILNTTRTTP